MKTFLGEFRRSLDKDRIKSGFSSLGIPFPILLSSLTVPFLERGKTRTPDPMSRYGLLLIAFFLFTGSQGYGQQTTQYTQYMLEPFLVNPGVAGSKECLDIRAGYREQWSGFEGAPVQMYVNAHTSIPIKEKKHLKLKHGVGGMVENDQTGPTSRTKVHLAYAYHFPFNRNLMVSAGLFAGFQQYRLNTNQIRVIDFNDPLVNESRSEFLVPEFSPGIWLYSETAYYGLTLRQTLKNKFNEIGDNMELSHHFALIAGKRFEQENGVTWMPSALLKIAPGSTPALDLNLLADFYDQFAVGLSYRNMDALAGVAQINFGKFSLGYSFDFTTSKIRLANSNTHEISLGLNLCPQKGGGKSTLSCPAYY